MDRKASSALAVFFKPPVPGLSKTRLAQEIGAEPASEVSRALLFDLADEMAGLTCDIFPYSAFDPGSSEIPWTAPWAQSSGDLGGRMLSALSDLADAGAERIVLIGSDIPYLTNEIIESSFHALSEADVCIGPTDDGGYYLIGFHRDVPREICFRGIPWSTRRVFELTTIRASAAHMKTVVLQRLRDVDTIDDILQIKSEENPGASFRRYSHESEKIVKLFDLAKSSHFR